MGQCGGIKIKAKFSTVQAMLLWAVLTVGKAVCLSIELLKISGPAEPITTTLFFKTATGEQVRSLQ